MDGLFPSEVPDSVKNTDWSKFTDAQIKKQLKARGCSVKGNRKALEARLKAEVKKAWASHATKKSKKKLSPEEIEQKLKEAEERRALKKKRKAEHEAKMEEARAKKRQKKEASAKKQAELRVQQKAEKEERQKLQAFITCDFKALKEALQKSLDPSGKMIETMSFNGAKKKFQINCKSESAQQKLTKGLTISNPKQTKLAINCTILPGPVESRCVMFLYPLAANHPDLDNAKEWTSAQVDLEKESEGVKLWVESSLKTFKKFGKVVNVTRERGFLVVQFSTDAEAQKMMAKAGEDFNGVSFAAMSIGTPTKADKLDALKKYPMPKKVKKE